MGDPFAPVKSGIHTSKIIGRGSENLNNNIAGAFNRGR